MVQPTLNVVDRDLIDVTVNTINPNGATTSANSQPVVIATDQAAIDVNVASMALPTDAATETAQDVGNASLASIDTKILAAGQALMAASSPVVIASNQSAIPVSAASLPLPTGAATAANQATELASLASIDGKITTVNTGAVVVSSSALPTGAATAVRQDTGNTSLGSIDTKITAVDTDNVTITTIPLPPGASTAAKQDTGNGSLGSIDSKIVVVDTAHTEITSSVLPTGAATSAKQDTGNASLSSLDTKTTVVNTDSVTVTSCALPLDAATETTLALIDGSLASIDSKIQTKALNVQVVATDLGVITNSVIHGPTTAGGGTYVDVKVTPSGALSVDVGASVLPTGAATAAKQPALGTAGTASADVISVQGIAGMTPLDVTIGSIALPTGASTEAKQDTGNASLASIDSSAGVMALSLSNIETNLASLNKVEDTGHTTGDSGIMSLAVRHDTDTSLVATDLDYAPLQVDVNGNLKVAIISGAGSGGTAMVDDTAFTPTTSQVTPMGAFFNDTAPDSVDEGDIGAPRMSTNRNLYNTIRDAAGNERGVNVTAGNALKVDGSAVTQPVSAASLPLPTGAATSANQATEIASLASIDTKTLSAGQSNMAGSSPVVIASNQSVIPTNGNLTNNNAAPGATLQASMPALANAAIPSVTEGNTVLLSTDLTQRLRVLNEQDVFITGQSGQSALNNNIMLAAAGAGTVDTVSTNGSPSYRSFYCQIIGSAGIASGQVIFEGSNDGTTFNNLVVYDDALVTGVPIVAAFAIAASTNRFFSGKCTYKFIRCRISTVFAGGTIQAITRFSTADYVPRITTVAQATAANLNATVSATNLSCNVAQIAGSVPVTPATNGATNRSLVSALAGPVTFTDYSAQAWAAASGSGAVIANTNGTGAGVAYDVNLTAFTTGASTGLVVVLQESLDNGTTWNDIWHCEPIITPSHIFIPALPINGRRRMRWENLTGAATTATVTVTAMDVSFTPIKQVQYFDRTASVGSGTATSGTNSAAYTIAACKAITVVIQTGTATAPASWKVQMTNQIGGGNGANWYDASASTSCPASSMTVIPLTAGVYGKSIRLVCTATGTSALVTAIHIYGTN